MDATKINEPCAAKIVNNEATKGQKRLLQDRTDRSPKQRCTEGAVATFVCTPVSKVRSAMDKASNTKGVNAVTLSVREGEMDVFFEAGKQVEEYATCFDGPDWSLRRREETVGSNVKKNHPIYMAFSQTLTYNSRLKSAVLWLERKLKLKEKEVAELKERVKTENGRFSWAQTRMMESALFNMPIQTACTNYSNFRRIGCFEACYEPRDGHVVIKTHLTQRGDIYKRLTLRQSFQNMRRVGGGGLSCRLLSLIGGIDVIQIRLLFATMFDGDKKMMTAPSVDLAEKTIERMMCLVSNYFAVGLVYTEGRPKVAFKNEFIVDRLPREDADFCRSFGSN